MCNAKTEEITTLPPKISPLDESKRCSSVANVDLADQSFPVNEECTSVKFSPSGRIIVAGFADGTVRIFDLTGRFNKPDNMSSSSSGSSTTSEEETILEGRRSKYVLSKNHQRFGSVACQIHAKGVHSVLLMDVDVTEDAQWCFAGVLRGSMELVAVHIGLLEASYSETSSHHRELLDLIQVYRHSDAKLRGFGACTRVSGSDRYLLFTGKSIKNIHIWSFEPPRNGNEPLWQQLYDTASNGTTIKFLQFRRNQFGRLQGLSKSDGQKLRVWDLNQEDTDFWNNKRRPARPPFQDVTNTEATLGVAGSFCICGGPDLFNQISVVNLDVDNLKSSFNHTEFALPGVLPGELPRRQQRGDLKCVESVAGMTTDSGLVLLQLSDGTAVRYSYSEENGLPSLTKLDLDKLEEGISRQMTIGRFGASGLLIAVFADFNPVVGQGCIKVKVLQDETRKCTEKLNSTSIPMAEKQLEVSPESINWNLFTTSAKKSSLHCVETMNRSLVTPATVETPTETLKRVPVRSVKIPSSNVPFAQRLETITVCSSESRGTHRHTQDNNGAVNNRDAKIKSKRKHQEKSEIIVVDGVYRRISAVVGVHKKISGQKRAVPLKEASPSISRKTVLHDDETKIRLIIPSTAEALTNTIPPSVKLAESMARFGFEDAAAKCAEEKAVKTQKTSGFETSKNRPIHEASKKWINPKSFSCSDGPKQSKTPDKNTDQISSSRLLSDNCPSKLRGIESMLAALRPERRTRCAEQNVARSLTQRHEIAREKLSSEHKAMNIFLCRQMLHATKHALVEIQTTPKLLTPKDAKTFLHETLRDFHRRMEEIRRLQELESAALQAMQSRELMGEIAPIVQVQFPIPNIFDQLLACIPHID